MATSAPNDQRAPQLRQGAAGDGRVGGDLALGGKPRVQRGERRAARDAVVSDG